MVKVIKTFKEGLINIWRQGKTISPLNKKPVLNDAYEDKSSLPEKAQKIAQESKMEAPDKYKEVKQSVIKNNYNHVMRQLPKEHKKLEKFNTSRELDLRVAIYKEGQVLNSVDRFCC